jgi:hypothetical protein
MRLWTLSAALAAALVTAGAAEAKDGAGAYKAPRTAAGQPDLQGVWTNVTITPLERDPKLGDRLVLTEEEAKAVEGLLAVRETVKRQSTKPDAKVDDLPTCVTGLTNVDCGYNNFWMDAGTRLIRIDGQPRSSIIVSPKNGRLPLTAETEDPAVRAAGEGDAQHGNFDGAERRPLGERCLIGFGSTSGPPMLPVLYNNHHTIIQTPTEVMIEVEMVHDIRIIRLNDVHRPANVRQWMGDSIGHWEGETLVVETTNFRTDQTFRGATENQKVIERFTRISPQQILYQFEVIDPKTFTQPVKGEDTFTASKDTVYEYACHEGNYALPGILAGARREEKEGREMEGNRGRVKDEE